MSWSLKQVGTAGAIAAAVGVATAVFVGITSGLGVGVLGFGSILAFFRGVSRAPVALDPSKKIKFPLVERTQVSHDTVRLKFGLQSDKHILGLPVGKHINISGKIGGKTVVRSYTPTSSDDDIGFFELVVKVYRPNDKFPEGGKMSQYLGDLNVGDEIEVRGPSGLITYLGNGAFEVEDKRKRGETHIRKVKKIGMLAGGTGITPMLQVIEHILKHPEDKTEIHMIFANKTVDDILVREELEKCAKDPRFHLWYTLDNPPEKWEYSAGFISEQMISDHLPSAGPDVQVLMCGPPPMIKFACKPNLEKLGFNESMWLEF